MFLAQHEEQAKRGRGKSLKKAMFQTFECHIGVPCDGQYIKIHKRIKKAKSL